MRYVITGIAGFMGGAFARYLIKHDPTCRILGIDAMTYAGNPESLGEIMRATTKENFFFAQTHIGAAPMRDMLKAGDVVVNFAAETHVDRSILKPQEFVQANIVDFAKFLDACVKARVAKFVQVSTDEVYGDYPVGAATEEVRFRPGNPYSATKASAEMLLMGWGNTYGLPYVITESVNNYGPYQYPEKARPLWTICALSDKPLPMYGDGQQERCWIHVDDHASAVLHVIHEGRPGETYNIANGGPVKNREIMERILGILGKPQSLIRSVEDRPGHDRRYSLDASKLRALGWKPSIDEETGTAQTVDWYRRKLDWVRRVQTDPRYIRYMAENRTMREQRAQAQ